MIKLFDKDTIDFTTLGIGVLKDAISCEVAEKINADFEVEMEYPITGQLFNEIRNLRILYLKPNDYTNEQPFRIYSITKPIDGVVTINAQHISYDLSGYLLCPKQNEQGEYPIYTNAKAFFQALNAEIQNGNVYPNNCRFRFECDIEDETEGIQISEIANLRKILISAAEAFEGEYEFDRFVVRMKSKRGTNRGFSVTYSKNMVELEATVNSQGSATGIFPYFKSEETKTVQGINRTWVKVYIAQNGEYPKANWLTDKAESQQAVTPVINTQAYMIALRPDDPDSYKQYDGHIVIWRTTINNSYVIAGFTPDEDGNYPSNALSAEKDSDISIVPVNKHYYRTVSNSVYTYYKFDSTTNKYIKQNNEGEYEDITSQKPVFCFVNQNPTKDSSGETVLDEHYLVDDFGRELSPAAGKDYMTSLNEMIGIMNHFYYWTTDDFDNAIQLWVISGKEKNQNGNYDSDALTVTQGSALPYVPTNDKWYKISVDSSYEYYRYSSEEGFYMRQTGTGRYHEYSKDHKFEAAPTIIGTMSETKTLEHYVDLPEKIIYVNGLENQQYQKIIQVDLTDYLNDKLATRVGSTVYEYDKVTINENSVMYSSEWLDVGGTPDLDFIAQQITTADKTDENGKNFYGRLFCWNGSNYYEVYSLPRTYLVANPEPADSNGNYNYNQFSTEVNGTPLDPRAGFYYKLLQGSTYIYYEYNTSIIHWEFKANSAGFYRHVTDSDEYISVYVEGKSTYYSDSETYYVKDGSSYVVTTELAENLATYCEQRGMFEKCKNSDGTPKNPSQFPEDEALCVDGEGKKYVEPRRKRILNSAEPSEQELRDAAVEYLEKNDVNVANNTFTVTFAKLSRSPEYSKWKELEHVELGDSISIIYSDLGVVQHEIEVVGLAYDAINDKYTQVELGNVATSLADTAVTSNDGVSVLKNDKGYTDVKKVADIIAENITANYIKAMTAEFTEAQIQQLEATRLDITEALTASQASIDEIVSNLLIADDAVIKNTLTSGEISVKGDISIESGEINLGIIAKFNSQASNIYYKDGNTYKHVYDGENGIYFNPNTTYYVNDGQHPLFTEEKASDIGVTYGDGYQSVVGTFWEENKVYYRNHGTEEAPNWQPETITSENVGDYTELATRYVSVDVEDNLENYTDNYNGYRFNVENTGAMHIKNNAGNTLLDFDDQTGDLSIVGDIYAKDVIAEDLLIVGSGIDNYKNSASMYYDDDGLVIRKGTITIEGLFNVNEDGDMYVGGTTAETANMYYEQSKGLVINEGTIYMNDGEITLGKENNFRVDSDGNVEINNGLIQLGDEKEEYNVTPVAVCNGLEVVDWEQRGVLSVTATLQNGMTIPEPVSLDFTYTVSGDDLPSGLVVNSTGDVEYNEETETWWVSAQASLFYNGQFFVNNTGRDLVFDIEVTYITADDYTGNQETHTISNLATMANGSSSADDYYDTATYGRGEHLVSSSSTATWKNPDPIAGSTSGSGKVTIPANSNTVTSYYTINPSFMYGSSAQYTFTCPDSGKEQPIEHHTGYAFVVNNNGEMHAASGILEATKNKVTIAGMFSADSSSVTIGSDNDDSARFVIDETGMIFDGAAVQFRDGLTTNQINAENVIVNNNIQTDTIEVDDKLTLGNVSLEYVADEGTQFNISILRNETKIEYSWTTPEKTDILVKIYNKLRCKPTDSRYDLVDYNYSYQITYAYTYSMRFGLEYDHPLERYIFDSRAANIYVNKSPSPAVDVYVSVYDSESPSDSSHYSYDDDYYEYNSSTGEYNPITIDYDNIEDYCTDDEVRYIPVTNPPYVKTVKINAGLSGDVKIPIYGSPEAYDETEFTSWTDPYIEPQNISSWIEEEGSYVYGRKFRGIRLDNFEVTISALPVAPAGNGSITINGSIIPENPARDNNSIGTEDTKMPYGYFNNVSSDNYYRYISNVKHELVQMYVHHISLTTDNSDYIIVFDYQTTISESWTSTPTFIKHLYDHDCADGTGSLYYTGQTITNSNDTLYVINIPCTVINDANSCVKDVSIYANLSHNWYGVCIRFMEWLSIKTMYFGRAIDAAPFTNVTIHDDVTPFGTAFVEVVEEVDSNE